MLQSVQSNLQDKLAIQKLQAEIVRLNFKNEELSKQIVDEKVVHEKRQADVDEFLKLQQVKNRETLKLK